MSKVKVTVHRKVTPEGAHFRKVTLPELRKRDPHVRVGVFADAGTGGAERTGGLTNVEIAAIHEYGAPEVGIPERSFIRSTFSEHREVYQGMVKKLLPRVLEGRMEVRQMFDIIGQKIVADINHKVRVEGVEPPLAAATIAAKGSSRPLIDTARMLAAVTYVTVIGGEKSA